MKNLTIKVLAAWCILSGVFNFVLVFSCLTGLSKCNVGVTINKPWKAGE